MKIIFLLIISSLSFSYSQEDSTSNKSKKFHSLYPYSRLLKTAPMSFISGRLFIDAEYRLAFEKVHYKSASSEIAISYLSLSPILKTVFSQYAQQNSSGSLTYSTPFLRGFRIQLCEKFYISNRKQAPFGYYFGPHVSLLNARLSESAYKGNNDAYTDYTISSINFRGGYQFRYKSLGFVDMFFLIGFKSIRIIEQNLNGKITISDTYLDESPSNINFLVGFNTGISF